MIPKRRVAAKARARSTAVARSRCQTTEPDAAGRELLVEKLIPEGNALGRLEDGRVVILRGAMPGDRVVLERVSEQNGLVRAAAYRLSEPSPLRVGPRCRVFSTCGGCDWMPLRAEQQSLAKLALLREALLRTAKLDLGERAIELVPSPSASGYRRRIRLQVSEARIGFFAHGSHVLVEPDPCLVSSDALNNGLRELRELSRQFPTALAGVSWLELRQACDGGLALFVERFAAPRDAAFERAGFRQRFLTAVGAQEAADPALWQRFELSEQAYLLAPPGAFTQVNWEVNRALIARVLAGASSRGVRSFLDAYAGCGNFALPLLQRGLSGMAVECHELAMQAAREAARRQGLSSGEFVIADSAHAAGELAAAGRRFDLVLLDPPRAGVKHGLLELAGLAGGWLAICSCNPVTLARDLRVLLNAGFELEELVAFDMFPETHHLETLVWLRAPRVGT